MEVSALGPVTAAPERFSSADRSEHVAAANQAARLTTASTVDHDGKTTEVQKSGSNPAILLQAAHAQLVSQAGVFAALQRSNESHAVNDDDIPKVDGVTGGSVATVK